MAEQVGTRSGFVVHIPFEESETSERLPPALESACFRIAQEALTNIARHAKATQADSYTHLRAHETVLDLVSRLLLETKKSH